jgi:enoyl-CoA hydratase/3-hydroxyacyl-CoA dehydrogenase
MTPENVETVAVLGAGSMGHGIAEVASLAGYDVHLRDIEAEYVEQGHEQIEWSLQKMNERGQISADEATETLDRIETFVDLDEALSDVALVIEAVPERMGVKKELYLEADACAPEHAVFASNTSTLSITELSETTDRPEQFCGMHFFNPPVHMPLVEVIAGDHTREAALTLAESMATTMGKTPIRVKKDVPGFVVNRVLVPMLNEAAWLVETGQATIEEVDSTTKHNLDLPMGCLELTDQIGIDVIVDVIDYMYETLGNGYAPCPLLTEMVDAGKLGKKSGAGFYNYEAGGPDIPTELGQDDIARRIVGIGIKEEAKLVAADVAPPDKIDEGLMLGANFPQGMTKLAGEIGYPHLLEELESRYEKTGAARYQPSPLLTTWAETGGPNTPDA